MGKGKRDYSEICQNILSFFKKLPYDPAIPLLGIYSEKTIIQKHTCIPVFIAALFTIAQTRKQPKCPTTDEWIDVVYTYNEGLRNHKGNKTGSSVQMWMDLGSVLQSEIQSEKQISCINANTWNLKKMVQRNLS